MIKDSYMKNNKNKKIKNFGRMFRDIRVKVKKTQKDVATLLNCSVSHVCDIEHSRRKPFNIDDVKKCTEFFGVDNLPLVKSAVRERCGDCEFYEHWVWMTSHH